MKPVSGDGAAVRSEVWPFVWVLAPLDSRCSLGVGKIERGDRALCIDEAVGIEADLARASAEELLGGAEGAAGEIAEQGPLNLRTTKAVGAGEAVVVNLAKVSW